MAATKKRMHQTTVRFSPQLWEELSAAAERCGMSAAQFVREATVSRLSNESYERSAVAPSAPAANRPMSAVARSLDVRAGSDAVWAQARLARERAKTVRAAAQATQGRVNRIRAKRG